MQLLTVDEFQRFLPAVCCVAAGLLLLVALNDSLGRARLPAPAAATAAAAPQSTALPETAEIGPATGRQLAALHLFGAVPPAPEQPVKPAAPPPAPAVADVDKLPETALKLSLRGVLHDVDADNTVAIINVRGHDKAYRLNDEVPGNARITEITPLLIVLERDGKLERLSLKLPSTENDKNTAPASAGRSRGPKPGGKRNEIALKAARAG